MKVLFLYTEIASYFIKCCEVLSKKAEVHIIRWPVNSEAPFVFDFPDTIKIYDKNKFSFSELQLLIKQINPDILICSGWIDKDYLRITKSYFKKIPTVLTCDTHWTGTAKQYLAIVLSRFFLLNKFSNAWVPGNIQSAYLRKLGFEPKKIRQDFYCCDLDKFNSAFESQLHIKQTVFPKKFLFVGRYYLFKGIEDLWEAFIQLHAELPNEWELWCLGNGNIKPRQHPKIKHFGFVQPEDLEEITRQCGVFVLPSRFEPWGVVVQEYAASGFPLITSNSVGANETFLIENKNGFVFESKNISELKNVMKKTIALGDITLKQMAIESHQLAQRITPENWANTVLEIYDEFHKK